MRRSIDNFSDNILKEMVDTILVSGKNWKTQGVILHCFRRFFCSSTI